MGPDRRICFIVGFCFTTSPKMKAPAEVANRIELKIREERDGEKRYNFRILFYYVHILF